MSSWTIGRRIVVGFAAVIAIVAGLGVFAYERLTVIETQSTRITIDNLPGIYFSGQMATAAESRFGLVLKHVLATTAEQKTALEADLAAADARMAKLLTDYEGTITTTEDRQIFERCKKTGVRIREIRAEVMPLSRAFKTNEATDKLRQLEPAVNAYQEALRALIDFNKSSGDDASRLIVEAVSHGESGVMIALIAALIAGSAIAFFIVRATSAILVGSVRELTAGAEQVASAASQVSGSAQSLSTGRERAGGVARGDVGVDGGDGVDDASERRELAGRARADERRRSPRDRVERGARRRWSPR